MIPNGVHSFLLFLEPEDLIQPIFRQNRLSSVLLGRVLIDLTPMEGKFDDMKENYAIYLFLFGSFFKNIYSFETFL